MPPQKGCHHGSGASRRQPKSGQPCVVMRSDTSRDVGFALKLRARYRIPGCMEGQGATEGVWDVITDHWRFSNESAGKFSALFSSLGLSLLIRGYSLLTLNPDLNLH